MTVDELLSRTDHDIHELGSSFYFTPETLAVGREAGLDGLSFYFLGRGGVLGDVEPPVVLSAFGYFEPSLVAKFWNRGRAVLAPRDAARLHLGCAHRLGREKFAAVAGLEGFCAAAEAVVAAADPAGLPLFAGFAAEPLPEDLPARAIQLAVVLRELRGSVHLVAVVASGLATPTAHYLRRPDMFGFFGWQAEDAPAVSAQDRAALDAADVLTDRLLAVPYGVLDDAGRAAFAAGVAALSAAMAGPGA